MWLLYFDISLVFAFLEDVVEKKAEMYHFIGSCLLFREISNFEDNRKNTLQP